eukprot:gene22351-29444_t
MAKIIKKEELAATKWLRFVNLHYQLDDGPVRTWQACLVDPGETVETSALRELKEETGYTGKVVGTTGRQYLSPGLTPECIVTVFVEDAGAITIETLPINGLYEALKKLEDEEGFAIWVGLYSIAQGMRINSLMNLS